MKIAWKQNIHSLIEFDLIRQCDIRNLIWKPNYTLSAQSNSSFHSNVGVRWCGFIFNSAFHPRFDRTCQNQSFVCKTNFAFHFCTSHMISWDYCCCCCCCNFQLLWLQWKRKNMNRKHDEKENHKEKSVDNVQINIKMAEKKRRYLQFKVKFNQCNVFIYVNSFEIKTFFRSHWISMEIISKFFYSSANP